MTKNTFVTVHINRGYEVEDLGKVVILRRKNYSAVWFFTADGKVDETKKPMWTIG